MRQKLAVAGACVFLLASAAGASPMVKAAPDIRTATLNGRGIIHLRALRGKVVLVDFWATYCGPCHVTTPVIERLARQYRGRGFVVVSLSTDAADTAARVRPFLHRYGVTYPVAGLTPGTIIAAKAYGVQDLPSLFLIDRKGDIVWRRAGYDTHEMTDLAAHLRVVLRR